jgi:hypothetical protein
MKRAAHLTSIAIQLVAVLGLSRPLVAGGLSTPLGEVVIENLQVGKSYDLKALANLNLVVTNTSEFAVDLKMEILRPDDGELKLGALPIPDIAWAKVSDNSFTLPPGDKATSNIMLSIPDDDQYLGKKYQVMVWSHTVGESGGGMFMAYGLKSRIIFTTQDQRASGTENVGASVASATPAIAPEEIFVNKVALGSVYDVQKESGSVLTITNPSKEGQAFKLQSQTVSQSSATLTDGYQDAPDPSYLSFSESEVLVPPSGTKSVRMFVNFPEKPEYRGKRYMFIIHVLSGNEVVTSGAYSRLYMTTR